ncbi:MAG: LPS export ABC transporter periplasmic protein LptC [Hyphomicrobiaceae bacterium]
MALITLDHQHGSRGIVVAAPNERQKALRNAYRHSIFVRVLRMFLPVLALALLLSYGMFVRRTIDVETASHKGRLDTGTPTLSLGRPTMLNPSYEGFDQKDGSFYVIRAQRAMTDLSEDKPIDLVGIVGELTQKSGLVTKLKAGEGAYNRKVGRLDLSDGIDIETSNGMGVQLSTALVMTKEGTIASDQPVTFRFPAGELKGNHMRLNQKTRRVVLSKGVAARLNPQKPDKDQRPRTPGDGLAGLISQSNAPIDVRAEMFKVDDDSRKATFTGQVLVTQNDTKLRAKSLDILYGGSAEQASKSSRTGPASFSPASATEASVNRFVAHDDVVITRGAARVVASHGDFKVKENMAVLEGDVVMTSGSDRRVMANRAEIDTSANTVLLTGRVILTQGGNMLQGTRLLFDQTQGNMQLTSNHDSKGLKRRIQARFVRPGRVAKGTSKRPVASTIARRTVNQTFRTDPNAPIDVEATRLVVSDKARTAKFTGNVIAVQAGITMRTRVLEAEYSGQAGLALNQVTGAGTKGPAEGKKTGAKQQVALRRIRAPHRITISSGEGHSASGNQGTFDLARNEVILSGNVVLKQGRQLIRGARLRINLNTGLSRIETNGPGAWGVTAAKKINRLGQVTSAGKRPVGIDNTKDAGACGGRMCAMFFPGALQRKNGARVKRKRSTGTITRDVDAPPQKKTGGWGTTTATPASEPLGQINQN